MTTKKLIDQADSEVAKAERLLTIAEAASRPGAPSEKTIRRHIAKGSLKVKRVGPHKRIRIAVSVFREYMDWQG